jgi:hypothetical protein
MNLDTSPICIQDTVFQYLGYRVECCAHLCATHFVLYHTHVIRNITHISISHKDDSELNAMNQDHNMVYCIANIVFYYHAIHTLLIMLRLFSLWSISLRLLAPTMTLSPAKFLQWCAVWYAFNNSCNSLQLPSHLAPAIANCNHHLFLRWPTIAIQYSRWKETSS